MATADANDREDNPEPIERVPGNVSRLTTDLGQVKLTRRQLGLLAGTGVLLGSLMGNKVEARENDNDLAIVNGTEISVTNRTLKEWKEEWLKQYGLSDRKNEEERRDAKRACEENFMGLPSCDQIRSYLAIAYFAESKDHNNGPYVLAYPSQNGNSDIGRDGMETVERTRAYPFTVVENERNKSEKVSQASYLVTTHPARVDRNNPHGFGFAMAFRKMEDALTVLQSDPQLSQK